MIMIYNDLEVAILLFVANSEQEKKQIAKDLLLQEIKISKTSKSILERIINKHPSP